MTEEENKTTSETSVNEENYASLLADALKQKDAEIQGLKEAQARQTKELTNMILNHQVADEAETSVVYTDEQINKLREELFNEENNNLSYCKKALELRKAILEKGGEDIFVPNGLQISPTREDYYRAEQTAEVMQECIDYADGDSVAFTNELMRRTKDVRIR